MNKLKQTRKHKNIPVSVISKDFGMTRLQYLLAERNLSNMTARFATALCNYLEVDINEIF